MWKLFSKYPEMDKVWVNFNAVHMIHPYKTPPSKGDMDVAVLLEMLDKDMLVYGTMDDVLDCYDEVGYHLTNGSEDEDEDTLDEEDQT